MGSKLRDRNTKEVVWLEFSSVPWNPVKWGDWLQQTLQTLAYPNADLEPAGLLEEVVFVPPLFKQQHYGRMLKALRELGYEVDPSEPPGPAPVLYTFPYDWRQDNRVSARQLGEAIDRWRQRHPGAKAWIIAHSMGGMVSRWYIEKLGGKDNVGRLFLVASPWDGAPRALQILFSGFEVFLRRYFNLFDVQNRTRRFARTLPSLYQLLPYRNPFLRNADNEPIDLHDGSRWLDGGEAQLLADGLKFNEELGTVASVGETVCFFGRKMPTPTFGTLTTAAGGAWKAIAWGATEAGDGTVPERSAVHPAAEEKLPFAASHGDIYVNPALLDVLKWELSDKYQAASRAAVSTERLAVVFVPDKDVYAPGEAVRLTATVHRNQDGSRVPGASITAGLVWDGDLPGKKPGTAPAAVPQARLWDQDDGKYEGSLTAPEREGYYRLVALVNADGQLPIQLEELIAVEAPAGQ
jgi:pimeloyl-ACP methyl ester carboxylesterase